MRILKMMMILMIFSSLLLGNRFYKKALTNYSMVQMEQALKNLDDAINRVDNDKETLTQIYALKAKIFIGLAQSDKAKKQFVKILFLNNLYEMDDGESPKVLNFFKSVKQEFLESLTVKLEAPEISYEPTKEIKYKKKHPIHVLISNMSGARDAKIYYRQLGHLNYSKADLSQTVGDNFEGYLPIPIEFPTQDFVVEYYIGVTDFSGNMIASSPNAEEPLDLFVNVPKSMIQKRVGSKKAATCSYENTQTKNNIALIFFLFSIIFFIRKRKKI